MTTKLITGTGLQLLRRYDKKPENNKAQLLDDVNVLLLYVYCVETFWGHCYCMSIDVACDKKAGW